MWFWPVNEITELVLYLRSLNMSLRTSGCTRTPGWIPLSYCTLKELYTFLLHETSKIEQTIHTAHIETLLWLLCDINQSPVMHKDSDNWMHPVFCPHSVFTCLAGTPQWTAICVWLLIAIRHWLRGTLSLHLSQFQIRHTYQTGLKNKHRELYNVITNR
jgi:hypothetical protein